MMIITILREVVDWNTIRRICRVLVVRIGSDGRVVWMCLHNRHVVFLLYEV